MCSAEALCLSYECSPSKLQCDLNTDAEPTSDEANEDFAFCSKQGYVPRYSYVSGEASNDGYSCLNPDGSFSTAGNANWFGSLDDATKRCDANSECTVLHDYNADGTNWRACSRVTSGTGAATMVKGTGTSPITYHTPTRPIAL